MEGEEYMNRKQREAEIAEIAEVSILIISIISIIVIITRQRPSLNLTCISVHVEIIVSIITH